MNQPIKLLLASAAINALAWIILIPVWQYPDEQAHFAQVQFTAEIGNVIYGDKDFDTSREIAMAEDILGTARDELGNNKFTYHPEAKPPYNKGLYGSREKELSALPKTARSEFVKKEATVNPPLYYNLAAIAYKIFAWGDIFTRVFAIRVLSALIFLATVLVAYEIGKNIFEKNRILPLSLAAIIAAKPMLVFSTTGVLPDTLTILLFSVFILFCLQTMKNGLTTAKIALLMLIIILGASTRQHFLITLFIIPLVILQQLIFNKKSRRRIIASMLTFSVLIFLASYFISPLSFIHRLDYPESSRKIPNNPLSNLSYLEHLNWTIRHSVAEVWPWFWGVYKWLSLTLPPIVYQIINRLIPLAIIGVIINTVIYVKRKDWQNSTWFFFFIITIAVYFLAMTTFDFLFRRNNGFSFGIQGRYFFPVIIPVVALILTGVSRFFETVSQNLAKIGIFTLTALFFIFNDFSLAYVSSSYYQTSDLATFIKHASQYKPEIFKGNTILVIISLTIILQTAFLAAFYRYIFKRREKIYQRSA